MLLYHYQKDITSAKIKKTQNYPFLVWQIILFSFFTCKLYTIPRNALALSGTTTPQGPNILFQKFGFSSFFVFSPTESSRYEKDRLAPDTLPFRYNPSGAEESPEIQVSGAASALRSHANPRAGGLATDGNEHVLSFRSQYLHWF